MVFGSYSDRLPAGGDRGRIEVRLDEGASVRDLADALGLPAEARRYVKRDDERLGADDLLSDGDTVRFVVPLAGG